MSEIATTDWSETANSNNAAVPNGFPEGQAVSSFNNCTREMMSALKKWYNRVSGVATTGGSANAYTLTFTNAPTLDKNQVFRFKASFTNTGAATLNINALGAKDLKKITSSGIADVGAGDIYTGYYYDVEYDASADDFYVTSSLGTDAKTDVDNAFTANQTITSTDAGAALGPTLTLHRDSASPADADVIGGINFNGEDDGSTATTYARINAVMDDVTDATEDGSLVLSTMIAGTLTEKLTIGTTATWNLTSGNLTFTSTDSGASLGPRLQLYRDSISPASNDGLGSIDFYGKNSADEQILYGSVYGSLDSETDAAEEGSVWITSINGGSADSIAMIAGNGGISVGASTIYSSVVQGSVIGSQYDNGATSGPTWELFRDSDSPAGGDFIGRIYFTGRDSGANVQTYAAIGGYIVDPTTTTEDGEFYIYTYVNGSFAARWYIGNGMYSSNATGGDKGLGTINADAVYDDNTLLTCYVLEAARTGDIDEAKWDTIASSGDMIEHYEEEIEVPLTSEEKAKAKPDKDGNIPETKTVTAQRRRRVQKVREHEPAKEFKRNLLPVLDRKEFARQWKATGVLPGMPGPEQYAVEGNISTGKLIQKLWQTVELQAVHIDQLDQENDQLASRIAALEEAVNNLKTKHQD